VSYSIRIKGSAAKFLKRVEPEERRRLVEAIDRLAHEPSAGSALKGEFSGLRRLRVGRYRIIY
jgi:mRNA interferase RelE/StbE